MDYKRDLNDLFEELFKKFIDVGSKLKDDIIRVSYDTKQKLIADREKLESDRKEFEASKAAFLSESGQLLFESRKAALDKMIYEFSTVYEPAVNKMTHSDIARKRKELILLQRNQQLREHGLIGKS